MDSGTPRGCWLRAGRADVGPVVDRALAPASTRLAIRCPRQIHHGHSPTPGTGTARGSARYDFRGDRAGTARSSRRRKGTNRFVLVPLTENRAGSDKL